MPELARRKLGNTGMEPMALGLGCAAFGGNRSSDRDTIEAVRRAIELGIDFFDTATRSSVENSLRLLKTDCLDACEAATTDIDPQIWRAFKTEFGVGL